MTFSQQMLFRHLGSDSDQDIIAIPQQWGENNEIHMKHPTCHVTGCLGQSFGFHL